jgi:hypothetical protein
LAEGRDPKMGSRLLYTNEIFQASKRRDQDRAPESVARSRSEARGYQAEVFRDVINMYTINLIGQTFIIDKVFCKFLSINSFRSWEMEL